VRMVFSPNVISLLMVVVMAVMGMVFSPKVISLLVVVVAVVRWYFHLKLLAC